MPLISVNLQKLRVRMRALRRPRLNVAPDSDIIISLTSFPARIEHVGATLDTLLSQTEPVRALVLTLSEEEFPERKLPRSIRARQRRGLTVMWVEGNLRSFKKLIPVRQKFPWARIITVDDDKLYAQNLVAELAQASEVWPNAIVGRCGRTFSIDAGGELRRGELLTEVVSSPAVYLLGGTGVLYPPDSIYWDANDVELIDSLCPNHDDAWFWAMSLRQKTRRACLGVRKPAKNHLQATSPSLLSLSRRSNTMPREHHAVFSHYSLLDFLPREETE